jgi:hypothetical protein
LGADHPHTAISIGNLAMLELAMERYEAAEVGLYRALEIFIKAVGNDHPYTQETIRRLYQLVQQAVEAGQGDSLSDHPLTQQLLGQLREE